MVQGSVPIWHHSLQMARWPGAMLSHRQPQHTPVVRSFFAASISVHVGCGARWGQASCTLAALLTSNFLDKASCGVECCTTAVSDCWQPCRPVAPSSAPPARLSAAGPPPRPWLLRGCRCARKSGRHGLQTVRKAFFSMRRDTAWLPQACHCSQRSQEPQ